MRRSRKTEKKVTVSLTSILIVASLVIGFGTFGFAAINMFRSVARRDPFLGRFFAGHIGTGVLIAFCGLLLALGIIIAAVNILSRVSP